VPWGRLSLWKWVPGISPGVKAAGTYGWRPTTLVVPNVKKIRGLKLPGTPGANSPCCGMTFTLLQKHITSNKGKDVSLKITNTKFYHSIPFWANTVHVSEVHFSVVIPATSRHNPNRHPTKNTYPSSPFLPNVRDRPKITSMPAVQIPVTVAIHLAEFCFLIFNVV